MIVERLKTEKNLPVLDKIKYLVPSDLTMSSLASIVRFVSIVTNMAGSFAKRKCKFTNAATIHVLVFIQLASYGTLYTAHKTNTIS